MHKTKAPKFQHCICLGGIFTLATKQRMNFGITVILTTSTDSLWLIRIGTSAMSSQC